MLKIVFELVKIRHAPLPPKYNSQIKSGFASLVLDEQGRSCKEAHEGQSTHGSTDLCLHADRNELQADRGRSLLDAKEKEALEGNGRRLKFPSRSIFQSSLDEICPIPVQRSGNSDVSIDVEREGMHFAWPLRDFWPRAFFLPPGEHGFCWRL